MSPIGNHWYQHLCRERGLEPVALFRNLIARYDMFIFRGYVNIERGNVLDSAVSSWICWKILRKV